MVDDYTRPLPRSGYDDGSGSTFQAWQLWAGGIATALVAALIALVGVVVVRGIFDIPVLGPTHYGTFGSADTWWLCGLSALAAILATGLMHVLLLSTPRPNAFFGWIVFLVTVVLALRPFTTDAILEAKIATGVITAIIGIAIGTLISGVAVGALRGGTSRGQSPYAYRQRPYDHYEDRYQYGDHYQHDDRYQYGGRYHYGDGG